MNEDYTVFAFIGNDLIHRAVVKFKRDASPR